MTIDTNGDGATQGYPPTEITDIAQLQKQVAALLERINSDPQLALAAAVNPLLALEELGFRLAPAVRREIDRRSRYTRRQVVRLDALRAQFVQIIPNFPIEDVDVLDAAQVRRLLRENLDVPDQRIPRDLAMPPRPAPDPLAPLADAHPALEALLGLRDVERSALRFAAPERYREIRSGKLALPIKAVTGRPADRASQAGGGNRG